jgi:hypothetical protein
MRMYLMDICTVRMKEIKPCLNDFPKDEELLMIETTKGIISE